MLDEVCLQFQRRVELGTERAEVARMLRSFRPQVGGDVRLDLGLGGEDELTLDALVAARRQAGRRRR